MTRHRQRRYDSVPLADHLHRRAAELLIDGKWHDRELVYREVGKLVPPGIAMRKMVSIRRDSNTRTETKRQRLGISHDPTKSHRTPGGIEDSLRSGSRAVVRDTLYTTAYETRGNQIRLVALPRVVRGDRHRGEVLLPVLNTLADTFNTQALPRAAELVRLVAHDNGLHLTLCPPDCVLGGLAVGLSEWGLGDDDDDDDETDLDERPKGPDVTSGRRT